MVRYQKYLAVALSLFLTASTLAACSKDSKPAPNAGTTQPAGGGTTTPPNTEPPIPPEPPKPQIKWEFEHRWGPIVSKDPAAADKKVVLLTFDDGPNPATTPIVLDTLKANKIKAIFFVLGNNAEQYPDLVKRINAEGHIVGNHTVPHEDLTQMTKEQQFQAIAPVQDIVEKIIGKKPKYFRPPFGSYDDNTLAIMDQLGLTLLNWDHGSGDWMDVKDGYKDPQIEISDVLSETPRNNQMTPLHPGAVILFHDTLKHTAEALPAMIRGLKDKGYEFVTPDPAGAK